MEKKRSAFELKWSRIVHKSFDTLSNPDMWFKGYASVFDVLDEHGDIVCKGAFKNFLSTHDKSNIKLLWQHKVEDVVGYIDKIYEDDHGLVVEGSIMSQIGKGKDLCHLIEKNAISALSIGYRVEDCFEDGSTRYITKINLLEISFVTFPANPSAMLLDYRYETLGQ